MKKKYPFLAIYLFVALLSICSCHTKPLTNDNVIFSNKNLFKNYGVIFDSAYKINIDIKNVNGSFTPHNEDVILGESIFVSQYNLINKTSKEREGAIVVADPKNYFWEYNRQYYGYFDDNGHRNLLILLFDYSKKRIVRKWIGNSWQKDFVIILAEEPPFNIVLYKIDLSSKTLHSSY